MRFILSSALLLLLVGCGGDSATAPTSPTPTPTPRTAVTLASPAMAVAIHSINSMGHFDCYKGTAEYRWAFVVANGPVQLHSYDIRFTDPDGTIERRLTGPSVIGNKLFPPGSYEWSGAYEAQTLCHPARLSIDATFIRVDDGSRIDISGTKQFEVRQ